MITNQSQTPVATSGVQSEAFFNVKQENLPWIFGILRNNLYSDKPLAILREYSANAVDAHVAAGKANRPFAVTMPTLLYPSLVIRDFGDGLSEDDVYNVFASYGASTKRNTNQQIGGFGLGSKSAFSYVNSFTIVSYFEGMKSVYEAFIDETNIGKVVKVSEEPTDEESGIEITVTVKAHDIPDFVSTAKNLFKHFTPKPIIKNNSELSRFLDEYVSAKPVLSGKAWTLAKHSYGHRVAEVYCVMGNIRYPIQLSKLDGEAYSWVCSLHGMELVLQAPIGSVKMSASRESLEYDELTIAFLNDAITSAMNEAAAQISTQIKSAKTMWDARILLREIQGKVGNLSVSPVWKGNRLDTVFVTEKVLRTIVDEDRIFLRDFRSYSSKVKWVKTNIINPKSDTVIYIDKGDVTRNTVFARIEQDMTSNNRNGDVLLARFATAEQARAFTSHKEIVGATIVDLASINYVPPKRESRGAAHGVKSKQMYSAFNYNGNKYATVKSQAWDAKDIDVKDGEGIYVRIHSFLPVAQESGLYSVTSLNDLTVLIDNIALLTDEHIEIIGFRSKVDGLGQGWTTLREKIEAVVKAELAKTDFQEIAFGKWVSENVDFFYRQSPMHMSDMDPDGAMGKLARRLASVKYPGNELTRYNALCKLANAVGMESEVEKLCAQEKTQVERMVQDVDEAYPMLCTVNYGGHGWVHYKDAILGYIALVDKQ